MLQCVAVRCSVLQCVAVCCSVLQCVAVCCSVLQCVAVCCSVWQCVAVRISRDGIGIMCVALCCNTLQHTATRHNVRCSVLQHTETQYTHHSSTTTTTQPRWNTLHTLEQGIMCVTVCCSVTEYGRVCLKRPISIHRTGCVRKDLCMTTEQYQVYIINLVLDKGTFQGDNIRMGII